MFVPKLVDAVSERIRIHTEKFVETRLGKMFLSVTLLGPLMFFPTVWEAWTAPNIDVLRTPTWPMLTLVNTAALILLSHKGDWIMRLVTMAFVCLMGAMTLAIILR